MRHPRRGARAALILLPLVLVAGTARLSPQAASAQGGGTIGYGSKLFGRLTADTPELAYSFSGTAGDLVEIRARNWVGTVRPAATLLAPDGQTLAASNPDPFAPDPQDATLALVLPQTGVYLLLVSAAILGLCAAIVIAVLRRERGLSLESVTETGEEGGVKWTEAFRLLRSSHHLQIIALVIGFAAVGAAIIEQQLNMAAAEFAKGGTDLEKILGSVQLYLSLIGFVIQVWLTSRIHRFLGIGFALLILPVSLGATALVMLFNKALWAPMTARISDTSLRYTVDKTTREILFLPLPAELKSRAKPFVDVTMDRLAKGLGGLLILVLIQPWGLNLTWQQLSYASLTMTALWIAAAMVAKRGYLRAFRQSLERKDVAPRDLRLRVGDLQTVETLIGELADPDEQRVIYAIDILESLDKRTLITPLLLSHESPRVRARALEAMAGAAPAVAERWLPNVQRMLKDADPRVREAAVASLASLRSAPVADLVRPLVEGDDPRLAATASVALAHSGRPEDADLAAATLMRLATDATRPDVRREVAAAIRQVDDPRVRQLLVPLLYDEAPAVAEEAMAKMLKAIVGLEIEITSLVGKFKLGQNKEERDLRGSAEALLAQGEQGIGEAMLAPRGERELER